MGISRIASGLSSPRATRFFFNRVARIYGWVTNNSLWRESLREMSRHFPPSAAELHLLDIGCGPGNSALQLLAYRPDLRIVGIDFSTSMLGLARKASQRAHRVDRTTWIQGDALRLPLPDSSVDAVTAHSVFYMLADRAGFLREVLRVLRPGGRMILLDPAAVPYPFGVLTRVKDMRVGLSVMTWHGVSRLHQRYTLEQMAAHLTAAGFVRVLTERSAMGYGILSRGEKPYAAAPRSTVERVSQTAALDEDKHGQSAETQDLQLVDSGSLATVGRGRFIFLLVRQTPNKPQWAIKPGEAIRWDAAMIRENRDRHERAFLLAFTSLPKAVEFMQPAVTSGLLNGINKVAKFDKSVGAQWGADVLVNPSFEALRESGRYTFNGASLVVDPARSVTGEE